MRWRSGLPAQLLAATLACAGATGCAGASDAATPDDASGPVARAGSPAEECLARATAERERSPDEPAKVAVRHVLVRYAGATRAPAEVTRSREQACLRALEALDAVLAGADFSEVVERFSEEAGAASRAGALGAVERSDLLAPFADAAFELEVQQVSDVVETEHGFHVIQRTD